MPTKSLVRKRTGKPDASLASYAVLRQRIRERLLLGQRRIEEEKVATYWDVGRMINQHIMIHDGRAEFGKKVIRNLAKDLGTHHTVLRRAVQFAEAFPIVAPGRQLTWSHYRALVTVRDEKRRKELTNQAARLAWTKDELEERIKKFKARKIATHPVSGELESPLPAPKLGSLYTYRIFSQGNIHDKTQKLVIDLGFETYVDADRFEARGFKAADIVSAEKDEAGIYKLIGKSEATRDDLYTYKAFVEKVVDGDTLRVHIDLGFGMHVRQYLRLRGINAPEIKTKAGQAAKRFVEGELKRVPFITIRTHRHDPFDRYLADVVYGDNLYLNQRLLDKGHALRLEN